MVMVSASSIDISVSVNVTVATGTLAPVMSLMLLVPALYVTPAKFGDAA